LKKALEVVHARELRGLFAKSTQRSWLRFVADAQKIKLPTMHNPFGILREQLIKFKSFRMRYDTNN